VVAHKKSGIFFSEDLLRSRKTGMGVTFRVAELGDSELLIGFMRQLYEHDRATFHAAAARQTLDDFLQDPSLGRIWLIELAEQAIGYVVITIGYSLEFHGRDAYVDELYISQDYRGQGIGTQTLLFLEEVCRSLNIKALHLEVEHNNTKAQEFYRKVGFCDRNYYLMTKRISDVATNQKGLI
jgi:diamine N-acetyltransferase